VRLQLNTQLPKQRGLQFQISLVSTVLKPMISLKNVSILVGGMSMLLKFNKRDRTSYIEQVDHKFFRLIKTIDSKYLRQKASKIGGKTRLIQA
jgi:hypothetical protein